MQKEIERNLNLRNEIRHRIITADNTTNSDKKKSVEGLKYLASERESAGLASLSTSTSSSTNSSILSTVMKKDIMHTSTQHHPTPPPPVQEEEQTTPKAPMLRPASFLTGFGGFGSDGLNMGGNFITRGMPPRTFSSVGSKNNEPSISTRFFQRLTSRLEGYEKKTWNTSS